MFNLKLHGKSYYFYPKKLRIIAILVISTIISCVTAQNISYCPKCDANCTINHKYYKLCYNESDEQAKWVAYSLTNVQVNTNLCDRTDDFRIDPNVKTGTATLEDYKGSGYDRGHLCPAADRHFSCDAMSETFFMSNMSPQTPGFNRGIWKKLEELVRGWALKYENIFVVTGPVLNDEKLGAIGNCKVTVPKYYYKTVLRIDESCWTCIALVLTNESGNKAWSDYVITVDSLERLTSIDFYPGLPDSVENIIESRKNLFEWNIESPVAYENKINGKTTTDKNNTISTLKQCTGTTQAGTQCKRMTKDPSGKCWQHGETAKKTEEPGVGYKLLTLIKRMMYFFFE